MASAMKVRMSEAAKWLFVIGLLAAQVCGAREAYSQTPNTQNLNAQKSNAQKSSKEQQPVEARCLQILTEALRADAFWPAMHAAEGLTLAGKKELVVEALEPRVAGEKDDQRRCGLARELSRAGKTQHVATLVSILKDTKSTGRVHAAESLFKLGQVGEASAMQAAYEQSDSLPLKLMAAAALIRAKPDDHTSHLNWIRDQLRSTESSPRFLAAFLLVYLGDRSDVERLRTAVAGETEISNKTMLHAAMAVQGESPSVDVLRGSLTHENPAVRTIAAEVLGAIGCRDCRASLEKLFDDEHSDARVRAATACLLLSASPTKGSVR